MSRVSDTRQRTREAAAALVNEGKRPHELTVDLIYAAIRQGSRTTINDELKLWKDERTKADALGANLPSAIADAMRSLWAAAVEQGEQVFGEQRQTLESDLATLQRTHDNVAVERDAALVTVEQLQQETGQLREQNAQVQLQLSRETEAKRDAQGQIQALQREMATVRADMTQQLEEARNVQQRLTSEFQSTITARDAAFQAERDKANERVEVAQTRMLQETDAARAGLRQAEQQLVKARKRNEEQQADLTELRLEVARHQRKLAESETRMKALAQVKDERDKLTLELATLHGRLAGLTTAVRSAEARAVAAESRLVATPMPARKRRRTG